MNTADILDKAADLITERGWNQHYFVDSAGRLCPRGAIYAACGMKPDPDPLVWVVDWPGWTSRAADDAMDACDRLDAVVNDYAESWNDAPGRTAEEVISTLRAAAQAARAGE